MVLGQDRPSKLAASQLSELNDDDQLRRRDGTTCRASLQYSVRDRIASRVAGPQ